MDGTQPKREEDWLASALERAGLRAFDPDADPASRSEGQRELGDLVSRTPTPPLMSSLHKLIRPGRVPAWLRPRLVDVLTLLPQRPADGVRATLEFVFSVHPSSSSSSSTATGDGSAAAPQKQGAHITLEALGMASTLLAVPPASVAPDAWFPGIAPQLLALLDGAEGADLARAAAYVVGFGVLGRKQFGAPGTPGWKAFAEPMLAGVDPSLRTAEVKNEPLVFSAGPDEVVDLRKQAIIVGAEELSTSLRRLSALLHSHPNPGLTKRLLGPLMLPLWAISSWPSQEEQFSERYGQPAKSLLAIHLKLAGSAEKFRTLMDNLLFVGNVDPAKLQWVYEQTGESDLQVRRPREGSDAMRPELDLATLDSKIDAFVALLQSVGADSDISPLFLDLFQTALAAPKQDPDQIKIVEDDTSDHDPLAELIRASVLQKMMTVFPDRLISNPKQLMELVAQVLSAFDPATPSRDDATPLALSLLNLVVTAPSFERSQVDGAVLAAIEGALARISSRRARGTTTTSAAGDDVDDESTRRTALNLSLLLRYRDALNDEDEDNRKTTSRAPPLTDRQAEDRRTYALALQYVTASDAPPPVRAEGVALLDRLIRARSAVVDVPATQELLCSLLTLGATTDSTNASSDGGGGGEDDGGYLAQRAARALLRLAGAHPRSVVRDVLDRYVDAPERLGLDARLRLGETLLQLLQQRLAGLDPDLAADVGAALLFLAGRRPRRPRTERRAAAAARLEERRAARRDADARAAWGSGSGNLDGDGDAGGDVVPPEVRDILAEADGRAPAERALDDAAAAVVAGWSAPHRRAAEDVRVRASALSVLGGAVDGSPAALLALLGGSSASASAALDLSAAVLRLEAADPAAAILRRAAALLVLSVARALAAAREAPGHPLPMDMARLLLGGGDGGGGGGGRGLGNRRRGIGVGEQDDDRVVRALQYAADTDADELVRRHARDALDAVESWRLIAVMPLTTTTGGREEPAWTRIAGLDIGGIAAGAAPRMPRLDAGAAGARPRIEEVE
ncbi:hypothetical protein GGR56DRAFT_679542 [Xylariaceae sp. FL0804]|nr:hypothetical protein GGR56DRAFT_679542 [Xylariaceae sp. FL0804]